MEAIAAYVCITLVAIGGSLLLWAVTGREQCPEREPDVSDEERAYLGYFAQTNKWEKK